MIWAVILFIFGPVSWKRANRLFQKVRRRESVVMHLLYKAQHSCNEDSTIGRGGKGLRRLFPETKTGECSNLFTFIKRSRTHATKIRRYWWMSEDYENFQNTSRDMNCWYVSRS